MPGYDESKKCPHCTTYTIQWRVRRFIRKCMNCYTFFDLRDNSILTEEEARGAKP